MLPPLPQLSLEGTSKKWLILAQTPVRRIIWNTGAGHCTMEIPLLFFPKSVKLKLGKRSLLLWIFRILCFWILCQHLSHGFIYSNFYTCFISFQFSSVQYSCSVLSDLCDPMNRSTPGLPVHHQLPEFTQTHVHRVSDAIQPSHPLSSPSPPAPNPSQHQSLFQWVNSLHEVAKLLEFQL